MPAATAARASPIVLRRTPPRKPRRWFIHQVSTPAATSRRSPSGVGRDITSPSTATITLEMPVHPDPTHRQPALRDSTRRRLPSSPIPASSGCARRLQSGRDSPTPSARHRRRTFPRAGAPNEFGSHADDDVLADRLHQRHADRIRREGVHTAPHFFSAVGLPYCRLSSRRDVSSHPVVRKANAVAERPRSRWYPLHSQHFAAWMSPIGSGRRLTQR